MSSHSMLDARIGAGARRLRLLVGGLMVGIAAALVLAITGVGQNAFRVEVRQHTTLLDPRLVAVGSAILLEIALLRLIQMLQAVEAGELFSAKVVRHFRGFAFWLLQMAILGVVLPVIGSLLGKGPAIAAGHFAFVLPLTDILTLGVTLLLFLLARLLERARLLEEENREFV